MKNFLFAFLIFLIWSVFGMWYYSCIIKELCNEGNDAVVKENIVNDTPATKEESIESINESLINPVGAKTNVEALEFDFPKNLGIKLNLPNIGFPDGSQQFSKSIFEFLNKNQNKELIITGLMNLSESVSDSELGVKRANFVKSLLVDFGINADKISVTQKVEQFNFDNNGSYSGGIQFKFKDLSKEKLKAIESGIANKTLYSGFGSKEFIADNSLQTYALELRNYLDKYPDKQAEIIGHTDSSGALEANDWYGMERAKHVRNFLIEQGISNLKLKASSKGEREPVASNATIEGRRKNRRIEIKVN